MLLDVDIQDTTTEQPILGSLVHDPNIISSKPVNLKVCAHASGAVYLFSIRHSPGPSKVLKYSVNLLHHNKTLTVDCDLKDIDPIMLPLKIDVSTFANGLSKNPN